MSEVKKVKKCIKCGREIEGKSHFGLCESCFNNIGSFIGALIMAGGLWILKKLFKLFRGK